jgi:hypothetical protein
MTISDQTFAVHDTRGFVHNGRIVYALQYDLESPLPHSRCVIVWLTPDVAATTPWIASAEPGRRIVTTKPGEFIRFRGELHKVTGVSVYCPSKLPETP